MERSIDLLQLGSYTGDGVADTKQAIQVRLSVPEGLKELELMLGGNNRSTTTCLSASSACTRPSRLARGPR